MLRGTICKINEAFRNPFVQVNIEMNKIPDRSFWISIFALSVFSSIALADPAEDLKMGEDAYNRENLTVAMALFTKAAEAGYAPAQVRLGEILDAAEFDKNASDWYRKAAEQENPEGEYRLGHMYVAGEGVEKNTEKAVYWFNRAASRNNLLATRMLAQAYRKGELGLTIDLERAVRLDERAAALGALAKR